MKKYFIFILLIGILLLGVNFVSANEIDNINLTSDDSSDLEVTSFDNSNELQSSKSEEIIVNNWDELQYYASQTDKDYIVKLKENTNFTLLMLLILIVKSGL